MTKTRASCSIVLLSLVAVAAPAAAQKPATAGAAAAKPAAAPPMPAPDKALEAFMKGFEGSWKCDTTVPAGGMGPGSPELKTKAAVVLKKEFGGISWHGEAQVEKSKALPDGLTAVFQIGWEPGTKQATYVAYDSIGGAFLGIGPISGESITFAEDGYMMGTKVKARETMTKKGPKEFFHKLEVDMGHGFQSMGEDTCRK
jgi:hypothetical protein